jgi:hypothetical protein
LFYFKLLARFHLSLETGADLIVSVLRFWWNYGFRGDLASSHETGCQVLGSDGCLAEVLECGPLSYLYCLLLS